MSLVEHLVITCTMFFTLTCIITSINYQLLKESEGRFKVGSVSVIEAYRCVVSNLVHVGDVCIM